MDAVDALADAHSARHAQRGGEGFALEVEHGGLRRQLQRLIERTDRMGAGDAAHHNPAEGRCERVVGAAAAVQLDRQRRVAAQAQLEIVQGPDGGRKATGVGRHPQRGTLRDFLALDAQEVAVQAARGGASGELRRIVDHDAPG